MNQIWSENETTAATDPHTPEATETNATEMSRPRRVSQKRRRPTRQRSLGRFSYGTSVAAAKLDIDEAALRQRARRCSRLENGQLVARLGMGVVGRKFGTTWRFFFDDEDSAAAT